MVYWSGGVLLESRIVPLLEIAEMLLVVERLGKVEWLRGEIALFTETKAQIHPPWFLS
jgi:hypothetical protein